MRKITVFSLIFISLLNTPLNAGVKKIDKISGEVWNLDRETITVAEVNGTKWLIQRSALIQGYDFHPGQKISLELKPGMAKKLASTQKK